MVELDNRIFLDVPHDLASHALKLLHRLTQLILLAQHFVPKRIQGVVVDLEDRLNATLVVV